MILGHVALIQTYCVEMNKEINPKSVSTDICGSLATGVRWLVEAPTSSLQEDGITLTTKRAHSMRVDTVLPKVTTLLEKMHSRDRNGVE